jgi:carbon-monoxide dehydrogenase large subunit
LIYDNESGQLLTGSYMDYCMPRADNLPSFRLGLSPRPNARPIRWASRAVVKQVQLQHLLRLMNALTNALGVKDVPMPATSQNVWNAMAHLREAAE